jgi:aerobic C4-dicarboxylate transport protein
VSLARPLRLLYVQVLLAMLFGMTLGHFWPATGALLKRSAMRSSASCE